MKEFNCISVLVGVEIWRMIVLEENLSINKQLNY